MAVWALARLLPTERFRDLAASRAKAETDHDIAQEWQAALVTPIAMPT